MHIFLVTERVSVVDSGGFPVSLSVVWLEVSIMILSFLNESVRLVIVWGSEIITSLTGVVVTVMVHIVSNLSMDSLVSVLKMSIWISVVDSCGLPVGLAVMWLEMSVMILRLRGKFMWLVIVWGSEIITSLGGIIVSVMVHVISDLSVDGLVSVLKMSIWISIVYSGGLPVGLAVMWLEVSIMVKCLFDEFSWLIVMW